MNFYVIIQKVNLLTFKEIEEIVQSKSSPSTYKSHEWWLNN